MTSAQSNSPHEPNTLLDASATYAASLAIDASSAAASAGDTAPDSATGGFLALIGGKGGGLAALSQLGGLSGTSSAPFAQEIVLIEETRIAGTTHNQDIEAIAADLSEGSKLTFVRDKQNTYDRWAIKVHDSKGRRVGFLSADKNEIPARLMDGGKHVYGKVLQIQVVGRWHKIEMQVIMDD